MGRSLVGAFRAFIGNPIIRGSQARRESLMVVAMDPPSCEDCGAIKTASTTYTCPNCADVAAMDKAYQEHWGAEESAMPTALEIVLERSTDEHI